MTSSLFVYGTLMSEKVLKKIFPNKTTIKYGNKAILDKYQIFKVINESYPAIFPSSNKRVIGKLLLNISDAEFEYLDEYEGDEYVRKKVHVHVNIIKEKSNNEEVEEVEVKTEEVYAYIFCDKEKDRLYDTWSFSEYLEQEDEFIKKEFNSFQ